MNLITFLKCSYYKLRYSKNIWVFYKNHDIPIKRYCGRKKHEIKGHNEYLYKAIMSGSPLFYGRLGHCEANVLLENEFQSYKKKKHFSDSNKNYIFNCAGMFSNDDNGMELFSNYQKESIKHMTAMQVWYIKGEELMIKKYGKQLQLIEFRYYEYPWQYALKGKKVLVVSSFTKSIEMQYKKRKLLFKDERMLPDFHLEVEPSVVSLAGNKPEEFNTWEEALLDTYKRCMKHDFEYVLIGAGSYSLPLGDLLFKKGKKVIVLNSNIQIMFGIYGERYLTQPWFDKSIINEHWVRPLPDEVPKNKELVNGGGYW